MEPVGTTRRRPPQVSKIPVSKFPAHTMERFLIKSERVNTEHKKRHLQSYHEDDGAVVLSPFERRALQKTEHNDQHFMDQLAAHLARQSGLVKLTDDGNKATFGKPSGDDVYISFGDTFINVDDCASGSPAPKGKPQRVEPEHEDNVTNPFDDLFPPDNVLASMPLP